MEFKDKLKELLANSGTSAYALSKATGISQGLLSDYKKGRSRPANDNLIKIATFFNVSIESLFDNEVTTPSGDVININKEESDRMEMERITSAIAKVLKRAQEAPLSENSFEQLADGSHLVDKGYLIGERTGEVIGGSPVYRYHITEHGKNVLLEYIQKYEDEDILLELLNSFSDNDERRHFVERTRMLAREIKKEFEADESKKHA